jgi:hypothetical protein
LADSKISCKFVKQLNINKLSIHLKITIMKKIMTFLAIMFVSLTMSFGQNTVTNGGTVTFVISNSGAAPTTNLVATLDVNHNTISLVYDFPITITSITGVSSTIGSTSILTHKSFGNNGIYSTIITNTSSIGFSSGYITINYDIFDVPEFTANDTLVAYNNGVASVPACTVNCDITANDTLVAYNNGYSIGFKAGVASVPACTIDQNDLDEAYDNGLEAGVDLTVNANDYQSGFEAGKQTCGTSGVAQTALEMGVSVYPNPVQVGNNITIDCDNFSNVVVLNIMGQVVNTVSTSNIVSTSDLTTGVYFLNVSDTDGNVSTTKVLVQ